MDGKKELDILAAGKSAFLFEFIAAAATIAFVIFSNIKFGVKGFTPTVWVYIELVLSVTGYVLVKKIEAKERKKFNEHGFLHELKKNWPLFVLLIPTFVYFMINNYLPMLGVYFAFTSFNFRDGLFASPFVGLKNFREFFGGMYFGRTLSNTLILSLLDLLICFPAPILLALMLNEVQHLRYKKAIQTVSYIPHFISMVVAAGLIKEFTNSGGVIARIVAALGGTPKSYISLPQYFRAIFTVSQVWQTIGFNSIIFLAALSGINQELYEAAKIDGASRVQQLWHVTLPGIASTIIIMLILRCGAIMNVNFEKIRGEIEELNQRRQQQRLSVR